MSEELRPFFDYRPGQTTVGAQTKILLWNDGHLVDLQSLPSVQLTAICTNMMVRRVNATIPYITQVFPDGRWVNGDIHALWHVDRV